VESLRHEQEQHELSKFFFCCKESLSSDTVLIFQSCYRSGAHVLFALTQSLAMLEKKPSLASIEFEMDKVPKIDYDRIQEQLAEAQQKIMVLEQENRQQSADLVKQLDEKVATPFVG